MEFETQEEADRHYQREADKFVQKLWGNPGKSFDTHHLAKSLRDFWKYQTLKSRFEH